jgi:hypothetical protein
MGMLEIVQKFFLLSLSQNNLFNFVYNEVNKQIWVLDTSYLEKIEQHIFTY